MSFRIATILSLGLLAFVPACDQGDLGGPSSPAPVTPFSASTELPPVRPDIAPLDPAAEAISIEGVCMSGLRDPDDDVNALLVIDLADADRKPDGLLAHVDDGREMLLTDDGKDGDAFAGDDRYSVAVVGPTALRGQPEACGDGSELGMEVSPLYSDPDEANETNEKSGYCPYRPAEEADCYDCGGQWRRYYRCSYWYGCYFAGYRCYGW